MDVDSLSGEIGKGLQWLRKSLLLTQYQLASFTELDYRHYQNIETGRVEVKVETLKRICFTFGIGLSTFFFLLDRRPWLQESGVRGKASGELFLFRMLLDNAGFHMSAPVQELLLKWGRDLAEGNRDNLLSCRFPCIETDASGTLTWKNAAAQELWLARNDAYRETLAEVMEKPVVRDEIQHFSLNKANSFYLEIPLSETETPKTMVLVGLRPMPVKESQTFFLAVLEINSRDIENGSWLNIQRSRPGFA